MFNDLKNDGLIEQEDRVGGGSFSVPSNIYLATIKMAYGGVSKAGAKFVRFIFDLDGKEFSETLYVTNKDGKNWYLDKNNGKAPLPGFTHVENICMMANETPLSEQDMDTKIVKAYDPEAGKETNQEVPALVDLIGKKVALGILLQIEDKYNAPGETREVNRISAVFHADTKQTLNEAKGGKDATFWDKWLEANEGKTRDISGKSSGSSSPTRSSGSSDSSGSKRTKSLFNK